RPVDHFLKKVSAISTTSFWTSARIRISLPIMLIEVHKEKGRTVPRRRSFLVQLGSCRGPSRPGIKKDMTYSYSRSLACHSSWALGMVACIGLEKFKANERRSHDQVSQG